MKRHLISYCLMLFICCGTVVAGKDDVLIFSTAESHGLFENCNCPENPGGGLEYRAALVRRMKGDNAALLLDAGGFAAGGIYDVYTKGYHHDSLRTCAMIDAMAASQYDAVALGDEELLYGAEWIKGRAVASKLPLISANVFYRQGSTLLPQYLFVKKSGITYGITAITSTDNFLHTDSSVVIRDPIKSLASIWKHLVSNSDQQIILSHLGEEYIDSLMKHFPESDLIVNGHRKISIEPFVLSQKKKAKTLIQQFDFMSKKIAVAISAGKSTPIVPYANRWFDIDNAIDPDKNINAILDPYRKLLMTRTGQESIDVYLMSQCTYGRSAVMELLGFVEKVPGVDLNLWFIGDVISVDSLRAPRGRVELEEELFWCGVQRIYPREWRHFLYLVVKEEKSETEACQLLKIDTLRIKSWIKDRGKEVLSMHYNRSNRLLVKESPTIFVNNVLFDGAPVLEHVGKKFCTEIFASTLPQFCATLPQCLKDADCRPGKDSVAHCEADTKFRYGGNCVYGLDTAFDFLVVESANSVVDFTAEVIETTRSLFPRATVQRIDFKTQKGADIIKDIKPIGLPLYLFGTRVAAAKNFSEIEKGVVGTPWGYVFKEGVMPISFFHTYPQEKKKCLVFLDIDFALDSMILLSLQRTMKKNPHIIIEYVPVIDSLRAKHDTAYALRCAAWGYLQQTGMDLFHREAMNEYRGLPSHITQLTTVTNANKAVFSSEKALFAKKKNELIDTIVNKNERYLINGPVEIVVENQQRVVVRNEMHFHQLVKIISDYLK